MYKEFIIIFSILILVIGLDFFTNNYVKETIKIMQDKLGALEENILQENLNDLQLKIDNIKRTWSERYNVLAYYIEHDELEKVWIQLSVIEANVKVNELENAVEDIEEVMYILKHIQEKEQFDFRSIF